MSYHVKFSIGGTPKSANALLGRHFWAKQRNALFWKTQIMLATKCYVPEKPLEKVRLKFIRYAPRLLDFDGCVLSLKPVADGLVSARILKNDTYYITGTWQVLQGYAPKGQERIEIEIIEAEPEGLELTRRGIKG